MGSASASGAGAAVRWPIGSRFGVELETELKRAEITAVNIALSLVYDLPAIGPVTPYVAAGVGLERFGKAIYQLDGKPLLGSDTGLTVNAGGGIRVPVNDRWGVRSDARGSTARVATRPISGASTTAPRSASAVSAESAQKHSSLELDRSSNARGR